ncbi:hypothetical protein GGR57DRAFT_505080 [Xylariaceae sp. FL1272]|nr:hypothetical protein GGR57DRAFT_505080 [Xylariaceae sp. FL1272]
MSRIHSPVFWSQSDRRSIILPPVEPVDETLPSVSDVQNTALAYDHQPSHKLAQSPLDLAPSTDHSSTDAIMSGNQDHTNRPEQVDGLLRAKKSFGGLRNLASKFRKDKATKRTGKTGLISGVATEGPSNASEHTSTPSAMVAESEDRDADVDLAENYNASLTSSGSLDDAPFAYDERDPPLDPTPDLHEEYDSDSNLSEWGGSSIEDFEGPMPFFAADPAGSALDIESETQALRERLGLHGEVPIPAPLRLSSTEGAHRLACIEEASEGTPSPKKVPSYLLKPQLGPLQPRSDSLYSTMPRQQTLAGVDKGKGIASFFPSAATNSSSPSLLPPIPPRAPERLSPGFSPTPRSRRMAPDEQSPGGQTPSESQRQSRSQAPSATRTVPTAMVLPPPCNPVPPCPGPPPHRPQPPTPAQREQERRLEAIPDAIAGSIAAKVPGTMRASLPAPTSVDTGSALPFVARPMSGSSVFGPGPIVGRDKEPIMTREEARRIALAPGRILPCPYEGVVMRDFSVSSTFQMLEDKHQEILDMRAKAEARRMVVRTLRPFSSEELERLGLATSAVSPAAAAEATSAGAASNTTMPEEKKDEEN